jgi:carboxymethylenebutenolidase
MRKIVILLAVLVLAGCATDTDFNNDGMTGDAVRDNLTGNGTSVNQTTGNRTVTLNQTSTNATASQSPESEVFGDDLDSYVEYRDVTGDPHGFLAMPIEEGEYPGVVMIHEWWGLNDNIKEMAKVLAKEGYIVFAVDLYDGEVATDRETAMELSGMVNEDQEAALEKMESAVAYLEDQGATSVGSLGWCFGGGQSLQLSMDRNLDATVIYYGQLTDNRTALRDLGSPVLGIFGEEDTSIPVSNVSRFESALNAIGVENEIYIYPGVGHAFANPTGDNFDLEQTRDAWEKTLDFLEEHLKDGTSSMVNQTSGTSTNGTRLGSRGISVHDIEIDAENYRFLVNGTENPTIRVRVGDIVRIELNSEEGVHDWVLDEFSARTEVVEEGDSDTIEFVADEEGTFEYYCSVGEHREMGMEGNFVVTE